MNGVFFVNMGTIFKMVIATWMFLQILISAKLHFGLKFVNYAFQGILYKEITDVMIKITLPAMCKIASNAYLMITVLSVYLIFKKGKIKHVLIWNVRSLIVKVAVIKVSALSAKNIISSIKRRMFACSKIIGVILNIVKDVHLEMSAVNAYLDFQSIKYTLVKTILYYIRNANL